MSRAPCSAIVASAACNDPTCLCASPLRLRMKTSHKGMVWVMPSSSRCRPAALALLRIDQRRLAHPRALLMPLAPRREAVAIARAVAGKHLVELFPVDRAVFPVTFG